MIFKVWAKNAIPQFTTTTAFTKNYGVKTTCAYLVGSGGLGGVVEAAASVVAMGAGSSRPRVLRDEAN